MKEADLFTIGNPCTLYCRCMSRDKDTIHAMVINGAWDFHLNLVTGYMEWDSPTGPNVAVGQKVSYTGPWPKSFKNYNEAIAFVDAQLSRPRIVRWWNDNVWAAKVLKLRLQTAWGAFRDSWDGIDRRNYDDEIPF